MATIEITIRDDEGKVLVQQKGDAFTALQWRTPYDRPISETELRPESDSMVVKNLFGFTFAPMIDRGLKRRT